MDLLPSENEIESQQARRRHEDTFKETVSPRVKRFESTTLPLYLAPHVSRYGFLRLASTRRTLRRR